MSSSAAAAAAAASVAVASGDDDDSQWNELAQLTPREYAVKNPEDEAGQRSFGVMKRGPCGFRINSSDMGTVCGLNPHKHPRDLYTEIRSQQDGTWERQPMSRAQQHGVTCEPLLVDLFKKVTGHDVEPSAFFRHYREELAPLFGASPDGIVLSRGMDQDGEPEGTPIAVLEIKAPTGEKPVLWDNYVPQIMAQMWMSGLKYAYFFSVWLKQDPEGIPKEHYGVLGPRSTPPGQTKALLLKIDFSVEYMKWMLPRMTLFSMSLVNQKPPQEDLYASEVTLRQDPPPYTSTPINIEVSALRVAKNKRGAVKEARIALTLALGAAEEAGAAAGGGGHGDSD